MAIPPFTTPRRYCSVREVCGQVKRSILSHSTQTIYNPEVAPRAAHTGEHPAQEVPTWSPISGACLKWPACVRPRPPARAPKDQDAAFDAQSDQQGMPLVAPKAQQDITVESGECTNQHTKPTAEGGHETTTRKRRWNQVKFGWKLWAALGFGATALLTAQSERLMLLIKILLDYVKALQAS